MKMFYLSKHCVRLRRNLIISAALLFVILNFEIKITKVVTSGVLLDGLTTEVVLHILFSIVVYHIFSFFLRVFEEFTEWRFSLANTDVGLIFATKSRRIVELSEQILRVEEVLTKILENADSIVVSEKEIGKSSDQIHAKLLPNEILNLKNVSKYATNYGKGLGNFSRNSRLRFWIWEIGVTSFISVIAVLYYMLYFTR